ncbi:MAG: hypothetical protein JSW21_03000 [Gammaproteobacteria bacterium]|nr:MAG: hypothetical protein JSW21_03000 [Gammaproteobacteria bacterium]
MTKNDDKLPLLEAEEWQTARDGMQAYARVLGKIRGAVAPHQKHFWHGSLRTHARGLTTTTVPTPWGAFEIRLDFHDGHATLISSTGKAGRLSLFGLSARRLATLFLAKLNEWGIELDLTPEAFDEVALVQEDRSAMREVWTLMVWADGLLKRLRAGQRGETSEVQIWPHHFDIAMLWISGDLVATKDPEDPEVADEQINVGFSLGDLGHPRPYLYLTVYPGPDGFPEKPLPEFAEWNTDGWTGVRIPYDNLRDNPRAVREVLDMFNLLIDSAASLLKKQH